MTKTTTRSAHLPIISLIIVQLWMQLTAIAASGSVQENTKDGTIIVTGGASTVVLDKNNGSIRRVICNETDITLSNDSQGLWLARFYRHSDDYAQNYSSEKGRANSVTSHVSKEKVTFNYESKNIAVTVDVIPGNDTVDFRATVTPKAADMMQFFLPARLCFEREAIDGITLHLDWPRNTGMTLNRNFFSDNSDSPNVSWKKGRELREKMATVVFGAPLRNLGAGSDNPLQCTPEATQWLDDSVIAKINGLPVNANRPFAASQADLVIAKNNQGVFFGASQLGGKGGYLFRIGGLTHPKSAEPIADMVTAAARKTAVNAQKESRNKIAIIRVPKGPGMGWGSATSVTAWAKRVKEISDTTGANYVELSNHREISAALTDPAIALILNPYGEMCPIPSDMPPEQFARQIRSFVQDGGSWFETAGASFWYELDSRYLELQNRPVPSGFADFFHFKLKGSEFALYSVQPMDYPPFAGEKDHSKIFTPNYYSIGGTPRGGYLERPFEAYIQKGTTWTTPTVRIRFGTGILASAKAFCEDNKIVRKLDDKMPPETLAKLKASVLHKNYARNIAGERQTFDKMPTPGIVHIFQYPQFGHDHGYPDHLPPNPNYASADELKDFIRDVRKSGSLFMPYTNNTWWCENPRGPTFKRVGDAALHQQLGKTQRETWGSGGTAVTMWHPEVRAANDEIIRQFTEDYPSDIVFQDQVCSRTSLIDLNPSAPSPRAYIEGIASSVRRDGQRVPLSTEDIWWGMVDSTILACGHSFGMIPSEEWSYKPLSVTAAGDNRGLGLPAATWTYYPLVQAMTHDKLVLTQHNLGGMVDNMRQLSLSLAFGFSMINYGWAGKFDDRQNLEWVYWVDRIQKTVCSAYLGEPLTDFEHQWGDGKVTDADVIHMRKVVKVHVMGDYMEKADDGVVKTTYGPVSITTNLGPRPLAYGPHLIGPYGFHASGKNFEAGSFSKLNGAESREDFRFAVSTEKGQTTVWLYANPGASVTFPLPVGLHATTARLETGGQITLRQDGRFASITLPPGSADCRILWKLSIGH